MSAGHTPGPWQSIGSHESEGFDCYWIKAQPSPALRGFTKEIAAVTGPQAGEAEANACLIAAAPELLAAAQLAYETLAPLKDDDFVWATMSQLVAAIAKATGATS